MENTEKNIKRLIDDAVTTSRLVRFYTADGPGTDVMIVSIYYKRTIEGASLLMDDVWHADVEHCDKTHHHLAGYNRSFGLPVEQSEIFDHVWKYINEYKTVWVTNCPL